MARIVGADTARKDFVPQYNRLLVDSDGDVRANALKNASDLMKIVGTEKFMDASFTNLKDLAGDSNLSVRSNLLLLYSFMTQMRSPPLLLPWACSFLATNVSPTSSLSLRSSSRTRAVKCACTQSLRIRSLSKRLVLMEWDQLFLQLSWRSSPTSSGACVML